MTDSYQRFTTTLKVFGLLLFTMATSFCSYGQEDNLDDIDGLLDDGMKSTAMQLSEIPINDKSNKVQVPDISKDIKINMTEEDTSFIANEINKNSEKKDTSIFSIISEYLLPFVSFAAFVLLVGPTFIN